MKKSAKRLMALVLVFAMVAAIMPINISAASYPLITNTVGSSETIPEGEKGALKLLILPKYKNEGYVFEVYNSDQKLMGKAEGTYYNTDGSFLRELTITIDASNYPTGLYTVKYWLRFYTLSSWHEEPTQHTAIFKVIPNLCNGNHNLTVQSVLSDATCKKEGTVKKVCSVCGHIVCESGYGDHTYGNWTTVDNGTHKRVCSECNEAETGSHSWGTGSVTRQPICGVDGETTYTCSVCNGTKTDAITATGNHSYTDSTTTTLPTCTTEGVKTSVCLHCGDSKTEAIPATGIHSYNSWEYNDENTHARACIYCGQGLSGSHSWNTGEITQAATCQQNGLVTYSCNVCGGTKNEEIPALKHTFSEATQVNDTTHNHLCSVCGETENEVHSWDFGTVTQAPTTEYAGVLEYTCHDCGAVGYEEICIGDLNHDQVVDQMDAEYLLWHTLFPENYPVDMDVDYDHNGTVDNLDVEYLLGYTQSPGSFPL